MQTTQNLVILPLMEVYALGIFGQQNNLITTYLVNLVKYTSTECGETNTYTDMMLWYWGEINLWAKLTRLGLFRLKAIINNHCFWICVVATAYYIAK